MKQATNTSVVFPRPWIADIWMPLEGVTIGRAIGLWLWTPTVIASFIVTTMLCVLIGLMIVKLLFHGSDEEVFRGIIGIGWLPIAITVSILVFKKLLRMSKIKLTDDWSDKETPPESFISCVELSRCAAALNFSLLPDSAPCFL